MHRWILVAGFISTLIASLSIAGGAPVGQYGPLVHFGATLAAILSRYGNLTRNASEVLLACGVAGVISAAFGAPIAAILFVHEVVLRHFSLRTFAPVTLASVVAYVVMSNLFPIEPFLSPINLSIRSADTILLLILTGLGGGMLAALFMQFACALNRRHQTRCAVLVSAIYRCGAIMGGWYLCAANFRSGHYCHESSYIGGYYARLIDIVLSVEITDGGAVYFLWFLCGCVCARPVYWSDVWCGFWPKRGDGFGHAASHWVTGAGGHGRGDFINHWRADKHNYHCV